MNPVYWLEGISTLYAIRPSYALDLVYTYLAEEPDSALQAVVEAATRGESAVDTASPPGPAVRQHIDPYPPIPVLLAVLNATNPRKYSFETSWNALDLRIRDLILRTKGVNHVSD